MYDRCSLLGVAKSLRRPLLLIHGLADDNVVAAHTLQLSRVLLEAGRSAQRAAALGRHPHDPARSRRREPPPSSRSRSSASPSASPSPDPLAPLQRSQVSNASTGDVSTDAVRELRSVLAGTRVSYWRAMRMRSRPARSGRIATSVKPAARASASGRGALRLADLEHERRRAARATTAPRERGARSPRGRSGPAIERADGLPVGDLGGSTSLAATYGGFDTIRSNMPRSVLGQRVEPRPLARARTAAPARPMPARLARATASASSDTSVAQTSTRPSGSSYASDSAIAPDPVPRSAASNDSCVVEHRPRDGRARARRPARSRVEG